MNNIVCGITYDVMNLNHICVRCRFQMLGLLQQILAPLCPVSCGFARFLFQNFYSYFAMNWVVAVQNVAKAPPTNFCA